MTALIARCPDCQTRYRLAREKIGPEGARLRCKQCDTVFRVQPPAEDAPSAAEPSAPLGAPVGASAPAPPKVAPPPRAPAPPLARALVATADAATAKEITDYLERWRVRAASVHDGAEALLQLFRDPPALVVVGANLPGLAGSVVAEVARRSGLPGVQIIRVASDGEPAPPAEFDAHGTLEEGDLCDGLGALLERMGVGARPTGTSPQPAPRKAAPAAAPSAPAASGDPEVAAAERLARIAVSDIILYNEEKFVAAARSGNPVAALGPELDEARSLIVQRVPEHLRANRDFLADEVERRAKILRES
jgi:predicted Zn finger-like uncharacterized protein